MAAAPSDRRYVEMSDASGRTYRMAGSFNADGLFSPGDSPSGVLDLDHGTKTTVTASATVLTPPTGCAYARFVSNVDCFVRTDGNGDAADDGSSVMLIANRPEVLPVTAGTVVKAYAATSAVVRVTPFKSR